MDYVSGEQLQLIAKAALGFSYDFSQNPFILENSKHVTFVDFRCVNEYDNPTVLFCYGHRIEELSLHINKLKNPFILISHNSDYNITNCSSTLEILDCKNLIKWFGQNVEYIHDKIHFLPIGLANQMWKHGDLTNFKSLSKCYKDKQIYMCFKVSTNLDARNLCLKILSPMIEFLPIIEPYDNIRLLKKYKFCICPDGNGLDTHRLWEALYVKTVPILLRTKFSENIQNTTKLPMILIDSWSDLKPEKLPDYDSFNFNIGQKYLSLQYYNVLIQETIKYYFVRLRSS